MFKDDCQKAKLTPDRDLSVMFSDYPLNLRRCLNFKSPLQMFFLEELALAIVLLAFNETIFYSWWVAPQAAQAHASRKSQRFIHEGVTRCVTRY